MKHLIVTALISTLFAGCGDDGRNRFEIDGRHYVVLPESGLTVRAVEEMIKSHAASALECDAPDPAPCRAYFQEHFNEYIRHVSVDLSGGGSLTYSLSELGMEHFRNNPDISLKEGCGIVKVKVQGLHLGEMRCSPEP